MINRIPVKNTEIEVGKPLPWDIYDPHGKRLAAENDVIFTKERMQTILSVKACRDRDEVSENEDSGGQEIPGNGAAKSGVYPFEAMKLKVGDRLQLRLPPRFNVDRVIVRLIGFVNNLSLLVTPPREGNGLRMQLEENDELVIRIFTSQNAFGFSASVTKVIKLPFEYMHISFPSEVEGIVIRKAPRVKTKIICTVIAGQSADESVTGTLINISANGALLASRQIVAGKSETIKLTFRVAPHGTEMFLNLTAVVRAQFADETPASPNPARHGLEFVDLQPKDVLVLQSMIYQQMVEQPHTVI